MAIDIFVRAELTLKEFVGCLREIIGLDEVDASDDVFERYSWRLLNIGLDAVEAADFEDDAGIPFSSYTLLLILHQYRSDDFEEDDRFRLALGRFLTVKLRGRLGGDVVLIRDMVEELAVE